MFKITHCLRLSAHTHACVKSKHICIPATVLFKESIAKCFTVLKQGSQSGFLEGGKVIVSALPLINASV